MKVAEAALAFREQAAAREPDPVSCLRKLEPFFLCPPAPAGEQGEDWARRVTSLQAQPQAA